MTYNTGMAHISLVLPFALPAPEFASDLVRALEAPALAALLSRSSAQVFRPLEATARALPHELWIARSLGLAHGTAPGIAASAMRGYGLDPLDGTWFVVNPAHIQIAHSHLMLGDTRQLDLGERKAAPCSTAHAPAARKPATACCTARPTPGSCAPTTGTASTPRARTPRSA
jgi:hypothetical protein